MAKQSSMQMLVDLAQNRTDEAARSLSMLVNRGEQGEAKLQLLRNYLGEYRARLDDAVREGLDGERLRNYLAFIARLERAIVDQTAEVEKDRARVEAARRQWQDWERRRRSYETLVERRESDARLSEDRAQQKQSDEFAARAATRAAQFAG